MDSSEVGFHYFKLGDKKRQVKFQNPALHWFPRKSTPIKHFVSLEQMDWRVSGTQEGVTFGSPRILEYPPNSTIHPPISSFTLLDTTCVSFPCSSEFLYCGEKSVFLKPILENSHTQTHAEIWKDTGPSVYQVAHLTLEDSSNYQQ